MESKKLIKEYEKQLKELRELYDDKGIKRTLRLFDIRFRLALDTSIDFKGEVSLTKTQIVKETYQLLIPLLDMWNVFECLLQYVKEIIDSLPNVSPYRRVISILPEETKTLLKETATKLQELYISDSKIKNDFDEYFLRLIENECIKPALKTDCRRVYKFIKNETTEKPSFEILGLIYAERNQYYHNGETAKMGMNYKNRKQLLCIYKEVLPIVILQIASFTIKKESDLIE